MATTSASIEIPVSADSVWQLIGGFNALPDWLPYIPTSALSEGGRVRSLSRIRREHEGRIVGCGVIISASFPAEPTMSGQRAL